MKISQTVDPVTCRADLDFRVNSLSLRVRSPWSVCVSFLLLTLIAGCSSTSAIELKKATLSIKKLVYDKDNRPPERVAQHPSVEANTHWDFEFVPEIVVKKTKLEKTENQFTSFVCVKKVKIDLRLPVQVWLPESASAKVIAHEDGHVAICRHYYDQAEAQAYRAAQGILERTFSGTGESERESMQKALEAASVALVTPYQNAVVLPANRASAIYDKLTNHGQASVAAQRAVKQAIDEAR